MALFDNAICHFISDLLVSKLLSHIVSVMISIV